MGKAVVAWIFAVTCSLPVVPVAASESKSDALSSSAAASASQQPEASLDDASPMRVSMEFQDTSLKDVLKTFSKQTGINLIAGKDIAGEKITIFLDNVTVMDALDQILRAANLSYERVPGSEIYIVKALDKDKKGSPTITRIYQLRYARVSKSALAKAAGKLGSALSQSSGGGGPASGGSAGGGVGIDVIIKTLLTAQGAVEVDGRTNRLLVTDVLENFPRIEAALLALDIRTPQILVDTELIETSVSKAKTLGITWGSGDGGSMLSFTPGSRTTRFPFGSLPEGIAPTGHTPFSLSTLSAENAAGLLQALESDTDTKLLARPKVLTLDNETAAIQLTSDEAIGFESTSQSTTGTTNSTPERETTGVSLMVTPQINEQGYITMIVEPTVTKTVASKVTAPSGQSTPRDPKTRTSRTMVRVRSGDTLVIGGLIDRSDDKTERRVPILSGIPFAGELFKHEEIDKSATELIAFVTPKILDEPSDAQLASDVQSPLGMREQEAGDTRTHAIEDRLNTFQSDR